MTKREWMIRLGLAGLLAPFFAGCSSYSPAGLQPGISMVQVENEMGPRTGTHTLVDGRTRVEFARGPFGKQTYMLDFDADGRLASWEQVLTESHFNALPLNVKREDVLRAIGRPSEVAQLGWQQRTLWSYRYDAPFCQWFQVSLDRNDRVVDKGYGPDPLCEAGRDEPLP